MATQTWQSGQCMVSFDESTGIVTVSGQGYMADYEFYIESKAPWIPSKDRFKSLRIQNGVVGIGNFAFTNCNALTGTLSLPASIERIGGNAFSGCTGFTGDLIFPDKLPAINAAAFYECSGFNGKLIIPEKITFIGWNAFRYCSGFHSVYNFAKTQEAHDLAFSYMNPSAVFYGYPENTAFKAEAGAQWRDIATLPKIGTLSGEHGEDIYPRTKGAAVYMESGKTLEEVLGGTTFWRGTQAEYNALVSKPAGVVYCIIGGNVIIT